MLSYVKLLAGVDVLCFICLHQVFEVSVNQGAVDSGATLLPRHDPAFVTNVQTVTILTLNNKFKTSNFTVYIVKITCYLL